MPNTFDHALKMTRETHILWIAIGNFFPDYIIQLPYDVKDLFGVYEQLMAIEYGLTDA